MVSQKQISEMNFLSLHVLDFKSRLSICPQDKMGKVSNVPAENYGSYLPFHFQPYNIFASPVQTANESDICRMHIWPRLEATELLLIQSLLSGLDLNF